MVFMFIYLITHDIPIYPNYDSLIWVCGKKKYNMRIGLQ